MSARKIALSVMGLAFAGVATRGLEAQSAPPAPAAPAAASTVSVPPPGPALVVINERCSTCHSTASVFNQRRSADDWAATVQLMVDRGADLTPDDMNMVIGYLAANFGPEPAKPAAK
jgi:mono/diheme cytochrome c family protein